MSVPESTTSAWADALRVAAQALALLWTFWWSVAKVVACLPFLLLRNAAISLLGAPKADGSVRYYEGEVMHARRKPAENKFRYAVRMAVLDLDDPPSWYDGAREDHLTADEARKFAGTDGRVELLTHPRSLGYLQNPISVYYCYKAAAKGETPAMERAVVEVTNTPWGERVTFLVKPDGETVPMALHVSPLMDMRSTWMVNAPAPTDAILLTVRNTHPDMGRFFEAAFTGRLAKGNAHCSNEAAGLGVLWKYGFQPQRVAAWIYMQALVLLWKGVPFFSPPDPRCDAHTTRDTRQRPGGTRSPAPAPQCGPRQSMPHGKRAACDPGCSYQARVEGAATTAPNRATGTHFVWRDAPGWPWRA